MEYGQQEHCFPAFHGAPGYLAGVAARNDGGYDEESGAQTLDRGDRRGDSKRDFQCHRLGYGMGPVIDPQLSQDLLDMVFDGKRADM